MNKGVSISLLAAPNLTPLYRCFALRQRFFGDHDIVFRTGDEKSSDASQGALQPDVNLELIEVTPYGEPTD
jgi:hypothetical protein